jgi:methyltransferase (TIGR00027 family)
VRNPADPALVCEHDARLRVPYRGVLLLVRGTMCGGGVDATVYLEARGLEGTIEMADSIKPMAFYCCGIRAEDARSANPLCGDTYAEEFMTSQGWAILSRFDGHGDARTKSVNVVRSRIFQDEIARRLEADRDLQIVNVGAGFDSRPYRLAGGRWFDIDEPALIAHKNACLPVETCGNPLRRIAVDFGKGELPAALHQCDPGAHTLVVIEGVLMYLDSVRVKQLLEQLKEAFPAHTLVCELLDKTFVKRYLRKNARQQTEALGSPFLLLEDRPEQLFLGSGYKGCGEPISVVGRALDFKAMTIHIPGFLFGTVLRSMRDGYRVHTFEFS